MLGYYETLIINLIEQRLALLSELGHAYGLQKSPLVIE